MLRAQYSLSIMEHIFSVAETSPPGLHKGHILVSYSSYTCIIIKFWNRPNVPQRDITIVVEKHDLRKTINCCKTLRHTGSGLAVIS